MTEPALKDNTSPGIKGTVALLGALDTKLEEFLYVKEQIEARGFATFVIDTSIFQHRDFTADVSPTDVASAGGASLDDLARRHDRGEAIAAMAKGAPVIVRRAWESGKFHGILAMGGGAGTAVGSAAMRGLPFGVPKLMVTTLGGSDTSGYVGSSDIVIMPSVADISGINRITRNIFKNAAGAICGMVEARDVSAETTAEVTGDRSAENERPLVAATMFGNTTRAVDHARHLLEEAGYEVLVFHATGSGGKAMESFIEQRYFVGVLDLTTTELADEQCEGVLSAGPDRLDAAARQGIPQVVTPACLDMVNFWAPESVPAKFKDRLLYKWNPQVTLMRTMVEENRTLGKIFADKLNRCKGPVRVFIPMGGFSELDVPGGLFWDPEADQAFVEGLKASLREDIPVEILDVDVNDEAFSGAAARALLAMMAQDSPGRLGGDPGQVIPQS
jgi:uncharacterized protein (UPF0261 family)